MYNYDTDPSRTLIAYATDKAIEIADWRTGRKQTVPLKFKCKSAFVGSCIDSVAFANDKLYIKWNEIDDKGNSNRKIIELVDIQFN